MHRLPLAEHIVQTRQRTWSGRRRRRCLGQNARCWHTGGRRHITWSSRCQHLRCRCHRWCCGGLRLGKPHLNAAERVLDLLLAAGPHLRLPSWVIAGDAVHDLSRLLELRLCLGEIPGGLEFHGLVVEHEAAEVLVGHLAAGVDGLGIHHRGGQGKRCQECENKKKTVHGIFREGTRVYRLARGL